MGSDLLKRFLSFFTSKGGEEERPPPEFVAGQLRKPKGDFAAIIGEKMNLANEPIFDLTLQMMRPLKGENLLEIGFGTGKFFRKLFSNAEGIRVSGVDFSNAMVQMARENNLNRIDSGELSLKKASSEALPFPENTFDKVYCNMVIYFWDQPAKHLKEIRRVLKPGGTFYSGFRTRESMQVFPFVEHGFNLYGLEKWQDILKENAFIILGTQTSIDQPVNLDSNEVRLTSCCVAAQTEPK